MFPAKEEYVRADPPVTTIEEWPDRRSQRLTDGLIVTIPDRGLGNSAYIVDPGDGRYVVIDPPRDPSPFLEYGARIGSKPAHSIETHLHADFISGSRELSAEGALVLAPCGAGMEFPHQGLDDGDEVNLGGLIIRAIATPGHTPEHLSYLILDGTQPIALFSGGALLSGSVARTDLIAPGETETLARSLWRSLRERILKLPDDLPVFPTHGTGATFCSASASSSTTPTTIGREKSSNPLLAASSEDEFVKLLTAGYGTYPRYFNRLREVNRRGPTLYGSKPPPLAHLSIERVEVLIADGAAVIDARPIADYAAGHIPGSISIELRPAFATWLGWLVENDRQLVFVLSDDADRNELVRAALEVGYEDLAGELDGGLRGWEAAGRSVGRTPIVGSGNLPSSRGSIIDVRQRGEFLAGGVSESINIELGELEERASDLPGGRLLLMCGHGQRAMTAASLLERSGRTDVSVFGGTPRQLSDAMPASVATDS
jgi:glyoxylase-like metal-dependent hydrolase (beta-lactamase superfamily II)/rhodanese-related sulfurtransferase